MAGVVPPTYLTEINFAYTGSASGTAAVGVALRRTGNQTVEADIDLTGDAYINLPIAVWIAPEKVLSGNVGFWAAVALWLEERRHRH